MRQMTILVAVMLFVAQATAQDASKVVFVPASQLHSDLGKAAELVPGLRFLRVVDTPEYLSGVIHRTAITFGEVHKHMTDIWYVTEGGGILVTGGSLTAATENSPGEFRGSAISGGDEQKIAKGDFVRIPAGVPHWIRKIDGKELEYLIVKVPSPK